MFDNNFDKCGPIFKILSQGDSYENSLCIHHIPLAICCYTTLWNSKM